MKIALLIQNADRRSGGAEGYTLDLARSLTSRGHKVTVISEGGPAAVAESAQASGFRCMYVGASGGTRWKRMQDFIHRLKDVYENQSYEIVHAMLPCWKCDVYQPHSGLAMDLLLTGHLKHTSKFKQRWARFFNTYNLKRKGLARIERSMMEHQPWIFCLSSAMREFARSQFALPESHLVTLMNGIDLVKFDPAIGARSRDAVREEWRVEKEHQLALFVGNNWKLKGVPEAITALALTRDPKLRLMLVGRDERGPYKKLAHRLKVADRVIFVGSVSDPRPFYGAGDFLLLPSRRDTCSLVVLEALAMGLPVVSTKQNGSSEVVEEGRQGFVLENCNPKKLAESLQAICKPGRLRDMGQAALAMRPTLSFEHHVTKIEAVYSQIVAARKQPGNAEVV
jgi:UDP-glucose:(heptosyl)LPS alpha-1,3-glucosyltransferase